MYLSRKRQEIFTAAISGVIGQRQPNFYLKQRKPFDAAEASIRFDSLTEDYQAPTGEGAYFNPLTSVASVEAGQKLTWWFPNWQAEAAGLEFSARLKFLKPLAGQQGWPLQLMLGNSPKGYTWLGVSAAGNVEIGQSGDTFKDFVTSQHALGKIVPGKATDLRVLMLGNQLIVQVDGRTLVGGAEGSPIPAEVPLLGASNRLVLTGEAEVEIEELQLAYVIDAGDPLKFRPRLTVREVTAWAECFSQLSSLNEARMMKKPSVFMLRYVDANEAEGEPYVTFGLAFDIEVDPGKRNFAQTAIEGRFMLDPKDYGIVKIGLTRGMGQGAQTTSEQFMEGLRTHDLSLPANWKYDSGKLYVVR